MSYWMEQLGFWGYMKQFPLNPISIVGGAVLIGIMVLFLNAALRKRGAQKFLLAHPHAAIMTFHKRKIGNLDYADHIRIVKLNNKAPSWFFLKPAIPAVYLPAGENIMELYADWARQGGGTVTRFKSNRVKLTVFAEAEGHYSLEYHIAENQYLFQTCDPTFF